jgi:hypothetical protein
MRLAEISSYELPDKMKIVRVEQQDRTYKWAVRTDSGCCLRKTGELEYEPLPSSRNQEFLNRTRFNSPEEAYAVWETYALSLIKSAELWGIPIATDPALPENTIALKTATQTIFAKIEPERNC